MPGAVQSSSGHARLECTSQIQPSPQRQDGESASPVTGISDDGSEPIGRGSCSTNSIQPQSQHRQYVAMVVVSANSMSVHRHFGHREGGADSGGIGGPLLLQSEHPPEIPQNPNIRTDDIVQIWETPESVLPGEKVHAVMCSRMARNERNPRGRSFP